MIREIVELESPSGDVERSKTVALWVENEARKIGLDLEIERIPADSYGEHLVIRAFAGAEKPVLLLGHTDTVHPVGTKAANPTRDRRRQILRLRYLRHEGECRAHARSTSIFCRKRDTARLAGHDLSFVR